MVIRSVVHGVDRGKVYIAGERNGLSARVVNVVRVGKYTLATRVGTGVRRRLKNRFELAWLISRSDETNER